MGKKFIHGVNGHFAQTYTGGKFVAMGPCPAQFAVSQMSRYTETNCSTDYANGRLKISCNSAGVFDMAAGYLKFSAFYTGAQYLVFTLSTNIPDESSGINVQANIYGSVNGVRVFDPLLNKTNTPLSVVMPYYRCAIEVRLQVAMFSTPLNFGDWAEINITMA